MTPEIRHCVEAAEDKKAQAVVVLDLRPLKAFTDYFVICHGATGRQVVTIADAIEERLGKELRRWPGHVEGKRVAEWVLLDYLDFVVHVFTENKRTFYGLERLWADAPRLEQASLEEEKAPPRQKPAPRRRSRPVR